MADTSEELLGVARELRDLLRLIAEPQIAARDEKRRAQLSEIVGRSVPKRESVLLMDGSRSQSQICSQTGIRQGHLSVLTKQLREAELLVAESQNPKLAIFLPPNFFDRE